MSEKIPISVASGDGIGPEIMEATLHILQEAGAELDIETIEMGEKVQTAGIVSGITPVAWESLRRTKILLKAPVTSITGTDLQNNDVTLALRRGLCLYANVRPCLSFHPYVATRHPKMDLVIIRENEEDVFAGIEYRQSSDVFHGIKLASRPGIERIVRYAFQYAQAYGRKKVTCFTKDNLLKLTEGEFHRIFDEIGVHFPEIEKEHFLADVGAAKLADTPEEFDVLLLPNLYGDLLSDLTAQIAGSVGLAGSANIGDTCAMFEAIHGSAPRRAGQNVANPSGLLLAGLYMLAHLGQVEAAMRAHNAWLKALEDGVHTYDIFTEGISKQNVGTKEFAKAVVERLGQTPAKLKPVVYKIETKEAFTSPEYYRPAHARQLVGADVCVEFTKGTAEDLSNLLRPLEADGLKLETLGNRGIGVWPETHTNTFCTDTFCARFKLPDEVTTALPHGAVVALLERISEAEIEFLKMELLYNFDGHPAFTRSQG